MEGHLNLDGGTRPPYNLSTDYLFIYLFICVRLNKGP